MVSKDKKRRNKIMLIMIPVILICLILGGLILRDFKKKHEVQEEGNQAQLHSVTLKDANGKTWKYNRELYTVLVLGIDKEEEGVVQGTAGVAGQCDVVMILSLNRKTKEASVLQISRDSMTDVDIYDMNGKYFTTMKSQLATQFAYNIGGTSSCWATKKTVSKLLYNLPIDNYVAVDLKAIKIMNNMVGGVTITVPKDYTSIDPAFAEGATVTLNGDLAEKYVRSRDKSQTGSNSERMERQADYVPALIEKAKANGQADSSVYESYLAQLDSYLITDMTIDQMVSLADYKLAEQAVDYVPGTAVPGPVNEEFHVDMDQLKELLIRKFYVEK